MGDLVDGELAVEHDADLCRQPLGVFLLLFLSLRVGFCFRQFDSRYYLLLELCYTFD